MADDQYVKQSAAHESQAEVLRLTDVSFVRDSRAILEHVNLVVSGGEHWALLGPNGAGKTTILTLCGALEHPTRGSVRILGQQLGRVDVRELRESIGHVNPRHEVLSRLTVRDVVLTGATGTTELMRHWHPDRSTAARADELMELLGMADLQDTQWRVLSQGERARTLIARALLPEPSLLLFDEPTAGLDVAAREQFLATIDVLHDAHPDLSTVLVTHHLEELPTTTTHAALIKNGAVLASGQAAEVLTSDLISACYAYPIAIECRDGRWVARARKPTDRN